MKRIAYCDIETPFIPDDGNILKIKKIFCIGVKINDEPVQVFTNIYTRYSNGNLKAALDLINTADIAVFHNGVKFDLPVIRNLLGQVTPIIHDTLLLAKLTVTKDQLLQMDKGIKNMPKDLYGSYSLGAFGLRMSNLKGDFKDFTQLSEEMVEYLKQDVLVTKDLYEILVSMENFPPDNVIELETQVAEITFQQERNGFYFDIEKAKEFNTKLLFEKFSIERRLKKQFKPLFLPDGDLKKTNKLIKIKKYIPINKDFKW